MSVKIIECPRDAMQGIHEFIDTKTKVEYLEALLKVGFDVIDCGSFVSPKAIPQLRDTAEVLDKIELNETKSKLLVIVANSRGADDAVNFEKVSYLGFPLSLSETFQKRNTNASIEEAFDTVKYIQDSCNRTGKKQVVYLSMGFGNPYNDPWDAESVLKWVDKLHDAGIRNISLADTVGLAKPEDISYIFSNIIPAYPAIEFGAHFHSRPDNWKEKLEAAYSSGCMQYDSAIKGYGGCPMADDKLTGNMPTENLLLFLEEKGMKTGIDEDAFAEAFALSSSVFTSY